MNSLANINAMYQWTCSFYEIVPTLDKLNPSIKDDKVLGSTFGAFTPLRMKELRRYSHCASAKLCVHGTYQGQIGIFDHTMPRSITTGHKAHRRWTTTRSKVYSRWTNMKARRTKVSLGSRS